MKTLYLCGAGNPEGVRLALAVNRASHRWERIVLLDDDSAKQGRSILDVEITGPFAMLEKANAGTDEISNLVSRTTTRRQAAIDKLRPYGIPFATLIHPSVDTTGVTLTGDVTAYENAVLSAISTIDAGTVIFPAGNVGHGARVGRCCVLAPGAVINARVQVAEGVYVGTNASVLPDLKVGAWASIGSNSAVIEDVPPGTLVMGVPAQILGKPNAVGVPASACPAAAETPTHEFQPNFSEGEKDALRRLRTAQREFIASHVR